MLQDDAIEDLDAAQGLWDEDYGSDSSDSDYTVLATPSRAHDAEASVSSSAQADPATTQTAQLMKMMLAMQSQFNESMLKMQKEAAVREERTSQIFHAIQQQQAQMNKAMARDRETTALMFDRLYQRTGIEPLLVHSIGYLSALGSLTSSV